MTVYILEQWYAYEGSGIVEVFETMEAAEKELEKIEKNNPSKPNLMGYKITTWEVVK